MHYRIHGLSSRTNRFCLPRSHRHEIDSAILRVGFVYIRAAGGTRTHTRLPGPPPQSGASTVPPLPHKIYQNKSRIRTDSHRLRAYAGYSPEPGITLRVFQFAPPYPSRLDWTRIRDFHHIFSGVIYTCLITSLPVQPGRL